MGLGGAKQLGEILKSSYGWASHKGGPFFMNGIGPSRHHECKYFDAYYHLKISPEWVIYLEK